MATGTVKFYNYNREKGGYGFIQPDDNSRDVFVDFNEVSTALKADTNIDPFSARLEKGQRVEYTPVSQGNKGPVAKQLKIL